MWFKFNKSAGQASKLLLVLAVIVLFAVVITFLVVKMAEKPAKPPATTVTTEPQPVYDQTMGNIRFVFMSALDKDSALKVSEATNSQYASSAQKDLQTTEKFIQVKIGAQNTGTTNTEQNAWDIQNIVDSQNREFVPLDSFAVNPWLPSQNFCGALLKPNFQPTPCTKIYEVSKESTGLKIRVQTGKDNTAQNFTSGKIDSVLIDLIVK
jgi:uncharacterized protein (UPF0333 family)